MTKISHWDLSPKVKKKMVKELWQMLGTFKSPDEASEFFANFFSPSEIIIFAKRLAASKRLVQKRSYGEIIQELKMSPATLAKIANRLRADPNFKDRVKKLSI